MRCKLLPILGILINLFFDGIGKSKVMATEMENSQITNQNIGDGEANELEKEMKYLSESMNVCKENNAFDENRNNGVHWNDNANIHLNQHHQEDGEQHGGSSHSGHLGHPRRKKRDILNDLLVSNLVKNGRRG
jgi:hypothetical protein